MAERIIHENFEKTDCPSVAVSELGRSDKGTWTMAYCSNGQRFAIISVYPPIALRCTQRTVDVC
jgi:hypothetical protein